MFPLGSVLFPHMPLALRVFEQRYRVMLARVLADDDAEFGVVLIERGREAGGGEQRFAIGTIARIEELGALDEDIALVARGGRRVEVVQWLDDDPHPMAVVRDLPELEWDESLRPMRDQAELIVRRAVSRASEFVELPWSGDAELSDDPVESSWQLAGIAPVGALDQLALLRSTSLRQLLRGSWSSRSSPRRRSPQHSSTPISTPSSPPRSRSRSVRPTTRSMSVPTTVVPKTSATPTTRRRHRRRRRPRRRRRDRR